MLRRSCGRPISSLAMISTLVVQRSSRRYIGSASFSSSTTNLQDNIAIMRSSADDNDDGGKPTQQTTTRRRTRRRSVLASNSSNRDDNNNNNIPSLKDFMHRAKVLKQYRNFIRLAQYLDEKDAAAAAAGNKNIGKTMKNTNDNGCRAALEEVRLSYKLGIKKGGVDILSRNMAYTEGERKLRELETMTGYSNKKKQSQLKDLDNIAALPEYDADSWINIRDEEGK